MRRVLLLTILSIVTAMLGLSFAQSSTNSEIAQAGKLRVGMNPATAVLLTRTPEQGITGGVGFELGKFIARKVGAVLELAAYPGSDSFSQSYGKNEWDIAFGSKTPLVEDKADFIADVLLNDYWFIAAPGREFANAAQVDRPGVKVGAGLNSSSDQFLSKTLKSAQLVRLTGGRSVEALSKGEVDVWAASASAIEEVLKRLPKAKIVPGNFTSERTMVILPKGRSAAAQAKIREIVNEAKKAGVVRKALEQTGTKGVRAAP